MITVLLDDIDITSRVINIGDIVHQLEHGSDDGVLHLAVPTVSIFASDILTSDDETAFSGLLSTDRTLSILRDGQYLFRGPVDSRSVEYNPLQKTCRFRALGDLMSGKDFKVTDTFYTLLSPCEAEYAEEPYRRLGYWLPCFITVFMQALGANDVYVYIDATLGGQYEATADDWFVEDASSMFGELWLEQHGLERSFTKYVLNKLTVLETLKQLAVAWGAVLYIAPDRTGYFYQRDYKSSPKSLDSNLISFKRKHWEEKKDIVEVWAREYMAGSAGDTSLQGPRKLQINADAASWLRIATSKDADGRVVTWEPAGADIDWSFFATYLRDYYWGIFGSHRTLVEAEIFDPEGALGILPLQRVSLEDQEYTVWESTTRLKEHVTNLKLLEI